jgi:catechol 2,3-dioxygenase-like lactoylglutathione lyase family enzyme
MQLKETITKETDQRPPVAIAHVKLTVSDVSIATDFFLKLGLRHVTHSEEFAVLELRGGTHLVLRKTKEAIAPGTNAPFDLMVDDVFVTRDALSELGFTPSKIETGRVHKSFTLSGPDGYLFTVTSSHTGGRVV